MAYYKCPDCSTYIHEQWGMLKGHMIRTHKREDLKDALVDAFAGFQITEQEYNALKNPTLTPPETPPPPAVTPPIPPSVSPPPPPPVGIPPVEIISEYVGEPVARLRQVLLVNGGAPTMVEIVTRIMSLSRWLWGNPYELESTLVAQFGTAKRQWVQQCVAQYIRGVDLPDDVRGISPYNYGTASPYGQSGYGFPFTAPYPGQSPNMPFSAPAVSPEMQELRTELARLREERQREHEQQLLNRIADLEKKMETGGQASPLMTRLEAIEKRLEAGGQASTMTIYDDKGNPMVLPYDRSYMAALNRKAEVETEAIRTAQMIELFKGRGGGDEKWQPLLESLKEEQKLANKRVEDLTKSLADQRIDHLEERVKAAEELAASSGGEGKGILEVASEAGADLKEGAADVVREVKGSVEHGIDTIREILTNRPVPPANATPRSPQEIADIMEAENTFLGTIGEL